MGCVRPQVVAKDSAGSTEILHFILLKGKICIFQRLYLLSNHLGGRSLSWVFNNHEPQHFLQSSIFRSTQNLSNLLMHPFLSCFVVSHGCVVFNRSQHPQNQAPKSPHIGLRTAVGVLELFGGSEHKVASACFCFDLFNAEDLGRLSKV